MSAAGMDDGALSGQEPAAAAEAAEAEGSLHAAFMADVDRLDPDLGRALRDCDGLGPVLRSVLADEEGLSLGRSYGGLDPAAVVGSAVEGGLRGLAGLAEALSDVSLGGHWTGAHGAGDRERIVAGAGVQRLAAEEALAAAFAAESHGPFAEAAARIPGLGSMGGALRARLCKAVFDRAGPGLPGPGAVMEAVALGRPRETLLAMEALEALGGRTGAELHDLDPSDPGRERIQGEARGILSRGVGWPGPEAFGREAARILGQPLEGPLRDVLYRSVHTRSGGKDPAAVMAAAAAGEPKAVGSVKGALEALADEGSWDHVDACLDIPARAAVVEAAQAVLERGVGWPGPGAGSAAGQGDGL